MSIKQLAKLKSSVQNLIDNFDSKGLHGAVPYLEDCITQIELAMDEMELEEDDWSNDLESDGYDN